MIVTAVQRGNSVYVYGAGNRLLFSRSGELHGFTSASVSVRRGNTGYVYNERGTQTGSFTAR